MENERARGCLRRNTCLNGVWAVAAVEVVGLCMVESAMEGATVVADDFCFLTVGNQIRLQLSSRLIGSKHGKMTVFGPFLCILGDLALFCDDVMLTSWWVRGTERVTWQVTWTPRWHGRVAG